MSKKLARFFKTPQEFVLKMAGHLDTISNPKGAMIDKIIEEATHLNGEDLEELLRFIEMKQGMRRSPKSGTNIKTVPQ